MGVLVPSCRAIQTGMRTAPRNRPAASATGPKSCALVAAAAMQPRLLDIGVRFIEVHRWPDTAFPQGHGIRNGRKMNERRGRL